MKKSEASSTKPQRPPKTRKSLIPVFPASCSKPKSAFESPFPKAMKNVCWAEYRAEPERMKSLLDWFDAYLKFKAPTVCGPAIVVDLDDSAFLGRNPDTQKANPLVKAVVKLAASRGCYVAFVTARPLTVDSGNEGDNRNVTVRQIRDMGYDATYHRLLMSDASEDNWETYDYAAEKKRHRDLLRSEGRSIVLNIGDQWTDHFARPDYDRLDSERVERYSRTKILLFENEMEAPERTLCVKLPESAEVWGEGEEETDQ